MKSTLTVLWGTCLPGYSGKSRGQLTNTDGPVIRGRVQKLFITFGESRSGLDDKPFGYPFLTDLGYELIYVAQAPQTQYQELELDTFMRLVAPLTVGKECFTYGSSLGGYCALYYGGVINAQIISASPRNSAHPLLSVNQFPDLVYKHAEIFEVPRSDKQPFIFLDRHIQVDARFYDQCIQPAYPDAREIIIPHAGHGALQILQEAKVLKKVVIAIANNEFSPKQIETDFSSMNLYLRNKAGYLLRKNCAKEAIEHALLSIGKKPSLTAYNVLIKSFIKENMPDHALKSYEEGLAVLPKNQRKKLINPTVARPEHDDNSTT